MKMMGVILIPVAASLALASITVGDGIKKSTTGTRMTGQFLPGQFPFALNLPQPNGSQTSLQTNILYGLRTPIESLSNSPAHSTWLVPGNYQSQPYACLIAVPEPTHDLCCVGGKIGIDPKIQISRPELQFIPRPAPDRQGPVNGTK
jgi:hypothetical protein